MLDIQIEIIGEIIKDKGCYCLAVRDNQSRIHENISTYFSNSKCMDELAKIDHYQLLRRIVVRLNSMSY